jgi:outer membrane protein
MNNKWKKMVASSLAITLAVLLTGGTAFAAAAPKASPGDVIGVIDSQLIVSKHPSFEAAAKQLQQVMRDKENEARSAVDKEPDPAKKSPIMQTKRMEAAREEQRLMEPIYKDCQEAVRVIAKKRNVTIVLEKASVYFGGEDITDYVIQELTR